MQNVVNCSDSMEATQEVIVAATQRWLSGKRKSLSISKSLDLFIQVLAVDKGLKPSLLYDSNGATAEQVQQYLNSLQSSQVVSKSLFTLDLNGNVMILNQESALIHLNDIINCGILGVVDVSPVLKSPVLTDQCKLNNILSKIQLLIKDYRQDSPTPLYVGEHCEEWNLCAVFGILLGYPVAYWFDQTHSFENCLSMTPLMVTTASATWPTDSGSHTSCLYSFSVPWDLIPKLQSVIKHWNSRLEELFKKQELLKDLTICQTTVTLPSVCL